MDQMLKTNLERPKRLAETAVPPLPEVDRSNADQASVEYSHYRTGLSNHRTGLSEHRTSLSEYRTDLSTHRTDLSTERTEMSMRRTGMSFQRTRMSAERTLMSVIRTSLSLISFGFTIFQLIRGLRESKVINVGEHAASNFGVTLVGLGILMLVVGIIYHIRFMLGLRHEREEMHAEGLIHAQSRFPGSFTLATAFVLLAIGVFAIISMIFGVGPF
jgi:uncharacterized membrane protein YidH (DUF202 family)